MTHSDPDEAREFAASFRRFLDWVHRDSDESNVNEVVALVRDFLGAHEFSVVSRQWSAFEQVNLQTALNAWSRADGRTVVVRGITLPPHYGELALEQLVSGEHLPPLRLSAPSYADLPDGPGSTLACLRLALLLVTDEAGSYVIFVSGPDDHRPELMLQLVGLDVARAQVSFAEIDALRAKLNVYRRQLIEVQATQMGFRLSFAAIQRTARDDVVLPEPVLARIERHAFGVAEHSAELLAAGQHLKRGLLLFGPPGTGKTHTTRYLVTHMSDYTRILLSGASLHAVASMTELARELAPAVVVLEDVDLVAEDRIVRAGREARCCSTSSTPWTVPPKTLTCCSCSRPTGQTCSNQRWRPVLVVSTSRSRSRFPTTRHGNDCSRCTRAQCRWLSVPHATPTSSSARTA